MVRDTLLKTAFFFLFPCAIFADNCCPDNCPAGASSCPWNDSCSDGYDHQCVLNRAEKFACSDKNICNSFDDCSDEQAAYRVGNLCRAFPGYNGGFPMDKILWDYEKESYECTKLSNNLRYCEEWVSLEDSINEYEKGFGRCVEESENGNYCQKWRLEQTEYAKCFHAFIEDVYEDVCCNLDNIYLYQCCQVLCDDKEYNAIDPKYGPEYEAADCSCTLESDNGNYCQEWHCVEYPISAYYGYGNGYEYEDYTCIQESVNGKNCHIWTGAIDGDEEFEVSICKCDSNVNVSPVANSNLTQCGAWRCDEKGVDYWFPNVLWCLLPFIFGLIFGLFLFLLKDDRTFMPLYWLCYAVLMSSLFIITAWKAGIWSVLFGLLGWSFFGIGFVFVQKLCPSTSYALEVQEEDNKENGNEVGTSIEMVEAELVSDSHIHFVPTAPVLEIAPDYPFDVGTQNTQSHLNLIKKFGK